jgi:organic radical activating enzyme
MSSFCFIATEKCNWDCEYCDFPNINNPQETNMEILKKHIPYIKEIMDDLGDLVVFSDISGGEIGLLPIEYLQYIFKTIDKKIVISTNGLFMEKKYHLDPILRPYINGIWLHVCQKPGKFKIDYDEYNDDELFINKGIVHDNIDDMVDFIKMNPQIEFNYVEFEFPISTIREINKEMYIELKNRLKKLPNVTKDALNLLEARINEPPDLKQRCMDYHQSIAIDLTRERILLCHRAMDSSIPLTKENLLKRLIIPPKDMFKSDKCKSCTRLYAGKMLGNIIEVYLKTKRHYDKKNYI